MIQPSDEPIAYSRADDERFMTLALREAAAAAERDEVPVGAIIVHGNGIIGRAHNQREMLKDPTAHAEMIAITQAAEALERWRLSETVLYVTLEPCAMCAGAIVLARIPRVVYGAADPKAGACGSIIDLVRHEKLNHRVELIGGILEEECGSLLRDFFARKRLQGKK